MAGKKPPRLHQTKNVEAPGFPGASTFLFSQKLFGMDLVRGHKYGHKTIWIGLITALLKVQDMVLNNISPYRCVVFMMNAWEYMTVCH